MRRLWLFKGNAINLYLIPGVGILAGRGQVIENLGTAEDFCRGTFLSDRNVGTERQSCKAPV